jgi:hypothetical protein
MKKCIHVSTFEFTANYREKAGLFQLPQKSALPPIRSCNLSSFWIN